MVEHAARVYNSPHLREGVEDFYIALYDLHGIQFHGTHKQGLLLVKLASVQESIVFFSGML